MVRRLLFVFISFSFVAHTPLFSQHRMQLYTGLGVNVKLSENSADVYPGISGSSLELGVTREITYPVRISGALEVGAGGVSNYLCLTAGVDRPCLLGDGHWEITPAFHLVQGMALFRPDVLYMWGLEEENFLAYGFDSGSALGMVIGFRLFAFPGYADYSSVFRFLDLTMGIRFRFK